MNKIEFNHSACTSCGICKESCSFNAIEFIQTPQIDLTTCRLCGACVKACPTNALSLQTKKRTFADTSNGIWVLAQVAENTIAPVTYQLIGEATRLAKELNQSVSVLLIGCEVKKFVDDLFAYGADRVYLAEEQQFSAHIEEHFAEVITALAVQYQPNVMLIGATEWGRGISARVAAMLKTGLTADCTSLSIESSTKLLLQKRPAFGGNLLATIKTPYTRPQMASVRPNVMSTITPDHSRTGEVVVCDLSQFKFDTRIKEIASFMKNENSQSFNNTEIIIGVGRGVKNKEELKMVKQLADKLGGMIAGSRAAVEAGLISSEHQVGQTGHTIAPKLYIACGISGQIQHTAAITSSEKIIAINCDPQAPIFEYAHFGIVGDLKSVLPQLINSL